MKTIKIMMTTMLLTMLFCLTSFADQRKSPLSLFLCTRQKQKLVQFMK